MKRIQIAVLAVISVFLATAAGWPTDHGNNYRSGYNPAATPFQALSPVFSRTLDGAVYGSPIFAGNLLIVATENNSVYALDPATGAVRWQRHLRAPITNTSVLACPGNISPTGITSTPVYDPVTNRVFVVTITNSAPLGVHHEFWGLRATDGAVQLTKRVEVPGTDPRAQQQRSALGTANGNVYIGFGGLAGDCGNYKGAMIALKANGAGGGKAYIVPTGREGAIWAAGGPVIGGDGSVYAAVGNGESTSGAFDGSDSITRLSPGMQRLDIFAPSSWASDNAADKDLGSMTPALVAGGFFLQAGKSGNGYVVRTAHLGGVGGQVYQAPLCRAFGVSAVTVRSVYMPCTDGVKRVDVGLNGRFTVMWTRPGIPGSPVMGPKALYSLAGTRLYAIDGHDGKVLGSINVGASSRFATPALVGNKVYVGTMTGIVGVRVG